MSNQENEDIKQLINSFLDILNLEATIEVSLKKDDLDRYFDVQLEGEGLSVLVGYHGKCLDALQRLINMSFNKNRNEHIRLIIDINNYRFKREEYLKSVAHKAIVNAKEANQEISLQPMNPAERRIIHIEIKKDTTVESESEGEDPERYVVVKPKDVE